MLPKYIYIMDEDMKRFLAVIAMGVAIFAAGGLVGFGITYGVMKHKK